MEAQSDLVVCALLGFPRQQLGDQLRFMLRQLLESLLESEGDVYNLHDTNIAHLAVTEAARSATSPRTMQYCFVRGRTG